MVAATLVSQLAVAKSQLAVASQLAAASQVQLPLQCQHQLLTQVLALLASVASFRPAQFSYAELPNGNVLKTFQT